jgi:DEAD/DEAH box helicase domain-containing protein
MRKVVFDIETKNFFQETGSNDPASLDIAVVCVYDSARDLYEGFFEEDLSKLWPILEKTDLLIGFNSDHFDIPLLNKYYPGDLTKIKSIDLLKEVKKSIGRRIKLASLAEATLGCSKSANGLIATNWWKEGKKEQVKKYCLDDVRLTKRIYDYAVENGRLKYFDHGVIKEIPLDTTNWEKISDKPTLNFTLPF